MGKAVWGIDVSKYSIKAIKLEKSGAGVQVTGLDVLELQASAGQEGNADEMIRDGLKTLIQRNKMTSDSVVCSLPGHATFNRFIKLPPVEQKRIQEYVQYEAQQHIPFPIDEVIWGYQPIERAYEAGEEKEVVIFAIKKDVVNTFLASLKEAEISIDALQFAPVGLYNFASYDQDLGGACLVLDMGADNTDLIVLDEYRYWIRNLPLAGNDLTKALQKKFQIPFAEAEKLKLGAGQSAQAKKIFQVLQPVLRDLVSEIHRSVGYYKSLSKTARFEKIMVVGNATKTINFQRFIQQNLQMDCIKLAKMNKISISGKVNDQLFQKHLASLGVAIGLGLQGLGLASNRINLLPADILRAKELQKKKTPVLAAAGIIAATMGLMYFNAASEVGRLRDKQASISALVSQVQTAQTDYDAAKAQLPNVETEIAQLMSVAPARDLPLKVLNELAAAVPDNASTELPVADKIWVLDTVMETVDIKFKSRQAPADGTPAPETTTSALKVTCVVGIQARKQEGSGLDDLPKSSEFIRSKLLDPLSQKFVAAKWSDPATGVELVGDITDWVSLKLESEAVPRLSTKSEDESSPGGMPKDKKYHRAEISWLIPLEAATPAPAKEESGGTGGGENSGTEDSGS